MIDHRQRLFSHTTIQEKCSWLRDYSGFEKPKTAGPRFVQTFRLLSNPISRRKSLSSQVSYRRKSSLPSLDPHKPSDSFSKYYLPQQHKYVNQRVGEIQLPVPMFQLIPPIVEELPFAKSLPVSSRLKTNFNYQSAENLLTELKTYKLQFERRVVNRRRALERCVRDLRAMGITPEDLMTTRYTLKDEPYAQPKSGEFLAACKIGDEWTARRLLEKNKYLVLVYDTTHATALHWAAKRNNVHIIALLMRWKAMLNFQDQVTTTQSGQTALYHAAKSGSYEAVRDLCSLKADPRRQTLTGDTALRVSKDPAISNLLKKAVLVRNM